jgi:hypothetical protein
MYYPDQRYASPLTVIRREAMLPAEALGNVRTAIGKRVDVRDVVANGVIPSRYIVLDAMTFFNLLKPEQLDDLMLVKRGDVIEVDQAIAGKRKDRGKRLLSPVRGILSRVLEGRVILQEMPDVLDVEAGVRGRVIHVEPGRGVIVEAIGAQTQGVWGNGNRVIGLLRVEPSDGLESIDPDSLEQRYAGVIALTRRSLTPAAFDVIVEQSIAGVIAPSMDATLIPRTVNWPGALLLTDGFGSSRMSTVIYNMLNDFAEQVATLDAYTPSRFETRTPEVIINVSDREAKPTPPNVMLALRENLTVRVTRDPYLGLTGKVIGLPKSPVRLPNGLRVPCAQVELVSGEKTFVPIANLEVLGR